MKIPAKAAFNATDTFVHLERAGGATALTGGEAFWDRPSEELDRDYPGRILGALAIGQSSTNWEMHPAGGELLYLVSGEVDVRLEEEDGESVVELSAGRACIVPRGVWHRVMGRMQSELLFIAPGKGTEHLAA